MIEFEVGHLYNTHTRQLTSGSRSGPPLPWPDEYARAVFTGEQPIVPGFTVLSVVMRDNGVAKAVARFEEAGRFVLAEFFNEEGFVNLQYLFLDVSAKSRFSPKPSDRPDHTFLSLIHI